MIIQKKNYIRYLICFIRFSIIRVIGIAHLKGYFGLIGQRVRIIEKNGLLEIGLRPVLSDCIEIQACNAKIKIGNYFNINRYSRIVAYESIIIGNNVTIAQFVSILDHDHGYKFVDEILKLDGYITSPIIIGDNVWISDKVTILKGVTIGNNVIIGANSLVVKNVPSNCIVGGVPAKLLKNI